MPTTFREISTGTIFKAPMRAITLVKFAEAIPRLPLDKQPPNCVCLENKHYFTLGVNSAVIIIKEPIDYDDSQLQII